MERLADFSGRTELFGAVTDWRARGTERYFLLGGGVGTGKTTAMARLVACGAPVTAGHVCDPADVTTRNPVEAAQALSVQLAERVEGFAAALIGLDRPEEPPRVKGKAVAGPVASGGVNVGVFISKLFINPPSVEAVWRRAVIGPLRRLAGEGRLPPVLIAVDALDEADLYDGRTKLADLVLAVGADLSAVRWLLSTRYPERVVERLPERDVRRWDLSYGAGGTETLRDVRAFLVGELGIGQGPVLQRAERRAGGNFLHARLLVETVRARGGTDPGLVLDVLEKTPPGLDGIQSGYLRQIVESDRELNWGNGYQSVFFALVAAQEPLDLPTLIRLSGIPASSVTRVLSRIRPLLRQEPAADRHRYSLHHAEFHAFLADSTRAGDWCCDPEEAHQRVMRAYEKQTATWTRWERLDDYGVRHLLEHARQAGWTAVDFDPLVVPGYVARAAEGPDAAGAVLRRLGVPIGVALAEPDPVRAFFWSWAARRIKGALTDLLTADMPTLLVKAGQAEFAIASLSLTADTGYHRTRLGHVVTALAGEGRPAMVRTAVSLAPREDRAQLLVLAATALAEADPEQAWTWVEETRASGEDWGRLGESDRNALLTALASVPALADRAAQLADDTQESLNALVLGLTRWNPRRAVGIAPGRNLPARGTAFEALAAVDPGQARALLGELSPEDWIRTRIDYQEALRTGASRHRVLRALASPDGPADTDLLLLAATFAHNPDDQELRTAAQLPPPVPGGLTDRPRPWPTVTAKRLAELDLAVLCRDPRASEIAASVVFRAMQAQFIARERAFREREVAEACGQLCAALVALDPVAADGVITDVTSDRPSDINQSVFAAALVGRLCPSDPDHAWRLVRRFDDHRVYCAWVEALPEARFDEGVRRVASVEAESNLTRAELAGLLAAKLPKGESERAKELLRLTSPIADGAVFQLEHEAIGAAFAPKSGESRGLASLLRRHIAFREQTEGVRAEVPGGQDSDSLRALADHVAAGARDPGIVLLAATAAELLRDEEHGDAGSARELLQACLDPYVNPAIGMISLRPRSTRAVLRAYTCWHEQLLRPLDGFVGLVLDRVEDQGAVRLLAHLLEELPPEDRQGVLDSAERRRTGMGVVLEGVLDVWESGRSPRAWLRTSRSEAPSDDVWRNAVDMALLALGRRNPREALDVLAGGASDWPARYVDRTGHLSSYAFVLPSVARGDRALAVEAANDLCGRHQGNAYARDTLRVIAMAVAEDDWWAGLRIGNSIDMEWVRGPALGSLAAAATSLSPSRKRHRAYTAVLESARTRPLQYGLDNLVRGLLTALSVDPEPYPDILAWLIPNVTRDSDSAAAESRRLGDLARLVARCSGVDSGARDLHSAASLATAAWRL
ncbi:hypothetical protein [Streptomyces sp. NPDC000888]